MKQVTLEIDDAIFHSAATKARQAGTSLSAVVIDFLRQFSGGGGSEFEQLESRRNPFVNRCKNVAPHFRAAIA